jgi:YD repeat-containing protein
MALFELYKAANSTNGLATYYDPMRHPTRFGCDLEGRLTWITNANAEVTQFGYNPAGNLTRLTDGRTNTTTWAYYQYKNAGTLLRTLVLPGGSFRTNFFENGLLKQVSLIDAISNLRARTPMSSIQT